MKIILKHSYYNITKTFENKGEMVDYIKNYLEYKVDAKIKSKDNVYDLREKFFNDYKMKVGADK